MSNIPEIKADILKDLETFNYNFIDKMMVQTQTIYRDNLDNAIVNGIATKELESLPLPIIHDIAAEAKIRRQNNEIHKLQCKLIELEFENKMLKHKINKLMGVEEEEWFNE